MAGRLFPEELGEDENHDRPDEPPAEEQIEQRVAGSSEDGYEQGGKNHGRCRRSDRCGRLEDEERVTKPGAGMILPERANGAERVETPDDAGPRLSRCLRRRIPSRPNEADYSARLVRRLLGIPLRAHRGFSGFRSAGSHVLPSGRGGRLCPAHAVRTRRKSLLERAPVPAANGAASRATRDVGRLRAPALAGDTLVRAGKIGRSGFTRWESGWHSPPRSTNLRPPRGGTVALGARRRHQPGPPSGVMTAAADAPRHPVCPLRPRCPKTPAPGTETRPALRSHAHLLRPGGRSGVPRPGSGTCGSISPRRVPWRPPR